MKLIQLVFLFSGLMACSSPAETSPSTSVPRGVAVDATWSKLEDMQGMRHDLEAALAEGNEVALVFWQTWCGSCIEEAPRVVEAARQRAETTRFFGVVSGPDGVVDDGAVREMTAELGLTYPQVRDRDAALAHRFDVQGTPTIVVIDPDGKIAFRGHRLPESWNTSASQH